MLEADEFAAWFRLLETPGVGRGQARQLLAAFGDPAAVLGASAATLRGVVPEPIVKALGKEPPEFAERLAAALVWRRSGGSRRVITLADAVYPPLLLQTADPPLLLYLHGRPELLKAPSLAVVGSRNPSAQGRDTARDFARAFAGAGLVVVSGLAQGIDGAAHEGALEARTPTARGALEAGRDGQAGAGTLAVVGTGLDRVFPPSHRALAHAIAETGLLASEYAPGTPPLAENFPQRNRIIAGLSLGTLVVEAALRSGSLITARLAAEAGREVFAVPGSIHAAQSRGCHWLIKQGAKLVESAADVLEDLGAPQPTAASAAEAAGAPPGAEPLLAALGDHPATLDALLARTGLPAETLSARLLDLELEGRVARLPGGLYQRRHAG